MHVIDYFDSKVGAAVCHHVAVKRRQQVLKPRDSPK
jgi:hypothetical protein